MNTIIYEDQAAIARTKRNIDDFAKKVYDVCNVYFELGISNTVDKNLFERIVNDPAEVVRGFYMEKIPEFDANTGLRVNREAELSKMKLPDTKKLEAAVREFNRYEAARDLYLCLLDEDLNLIDSEVEQFLDQYRVYAKSPAEVQVFEALKELEKNLNVLNELTTFTGLLPSGSGFISMEMLAKSFFIRDGKFELQRDALKNFLSKVRANINQ